MEFPEKIRRYGKRPKNKEATKRILIDAVGEIIRTEGYTALGVNNIALKADVDKILIYRYFTTPENLIETYVREKDYWLIFSEKIRNAAAEKQGDLKEIVTGILENQFDFFYQEQEMQQLILWEIAGKSELMKEIALARESQAVDLLNAADDHFRGSGINFRMLSALLSAGIYYMTLHKDIGEFCGIDLNQPHQREELKRTVRQNIGMIFRENESRK
jgi:AcrR family transcriptional regulator